VHDGITLFNGEMANRPRKLANALHSTVHWLCGHDDSEDVERTLRRLGEYIRRLLFNLDEEFPTRSLDPLRCEVGILAFPRVTYDTDHIYDFYEEYESVRDAPTCRQCEFRDRQRARLDAKGVDLHSEQQRSRYSRYRGYLKQAEWLDKALKTGLKEPSCWYCDRLGDTIIALSAPDGTTILTGDWKSFPALADILEKPIDLIPPVEELRRKPPNEGYRHRKKRRKRGKRPGQ
jgi:hypothetical protein